MLNLVDLVEVISDNLDRTGTSIGIEKELLTGWREELSRDIEGEGDVYLFTGLMYQQAPYLMKISQYLKASSNSEEVLDFVFKKVGSQKVEAPKNRYLVESIFTILKELEIKFSYSRELDRATGIILYRFGADDELKRYATRVSNSLESANIHRLLTIDPYTTFAMREIYPKLTDFKVEVINYLELISDKLDEGELNEETSKMGTATIHDPCIYTRYMDIIDEPREILSKIGVESQEVENSRKQTYCCGGPISLFDPSLSDDVARKRANQLKKTDAAPITMCPICLSKFENLGYSVNDISILIKEALQK